MQFTLSFISLVVLHVYTPLAMTHYFFRIILLTFAPLLRSIKRVGYFSFWRLLLISFDGSLSLLRGEYLNACTNLICVCTVVYLHDVGQRTFGKEVEPVHPLFSVFTLIFSIYFWCHFAQKFKSQVHCQQLKATGANEWFCFFNFLIEWSLEFEWKFNI